MIEPLTVLFGKEVLSQTVSNIYKGLDTLIHNQQFKEVLDDLDINSSLDIIHTFIVDLSKKKVNNSISKTLNYLEEILKIIEKEIENINIEIKQHQSKWFSRFRTSNCDSMIKNLIKHKKILDLRFDLLIKLINL